MSIIDVRLVRGRDGVWRATSADAEPQVFAVSGCAPCPMQGDAHGWPVCNAIGGERELPESIVTTWSGAPEWCPLRRGPTVVMLAE